MLFSCFSTGGGGALILIIKELGAPVDMVSLSHDLQGFLHHPRWENGSRISEASTVAGEKYLPKTHRLNLRVHFPASYVRINQSVLGRVQKKNDSSRFDLGFWLTFLNALSNCEFWTLVLQLERFNWSIMNT